MAAPGPGLGLAIVRSIIDAHHGTIRVHSEPGIGTTVRLTLPKV
jgi:signal transduction histidine kinase